MNRKIYLLLTVSLLVLGAETITAQPCPDSTKMYRKDYNGHTYYVVKEKKSVADANTCAASLNGHLAYINDQNEQAAIFATIDSAGVSSTYTVVGDGGGIAYVWIGGTDAQTEGDWKWGANGTSFWSGQGAAGNGGGSAVGGAYVNWGGTSKGTPNEPDDFAGAQDAAAIGLDSWPSGASSPLGIAGEWNDVNVNNQLYFVVEIDSVVSVANVQQLQASIYPNPAKADITITIPRNQYSTHISMTNITGQEVLTADTHESNTTLHTEQLPAGAYFIKIQNQQGSYIEKVVLTK